MFVSFSLFCFLGSLERRRFELLQQCSIHSHAFQTDCRRHSLELFGSSPGIQDTNSPEENNEARSPAPLVSPPNGWRYPNFDAIVDTIRNHVTMDRSSIKPGQEAEVYILEEGFLPQDRSWMDGIRVDRMRTTSEVLYRPQIVNNLVQRIEEILASKQRVGLLVKGPQGVGKSYSIINLTRYLMASGKYWVTIIPDCHKWLDELDFFNFLLQSVGVDPGLFCLDYDATIDKNFVKLIADIDRVLGENGMQWVFVFDQINAIFSQDRFQKAKDVNKLLMPFAMITRVLKPFRITAIISASANNEASYRENHEGFDVFEHPSQFRRDEIKLLYPQEEIVGWDAEEVEYLTGLVPLYLNLWDKAPRTYSADVRNEIKFSLSMLEVEQQGNKNIWNDYVGSAIQCLLGYSTTDPPLFLDRKFSRVQESSDNPPMYKVVSLFPLVEEAYRKYFWDVLFPSIRKREREVLVFCRGNETTKDSLGRCFEELVIARLVTDGLSPADLRKLLSGTNIKVDKQWKAELQQSADKVQLAGTAFPEGPYSENFTTFFIPVEPNFPAVDLIIFVRKIAIAIQIHTSSKNHRKVVEMVAAGSERAKWNDHFDKVILVYLSPNCRTKQEMAKKIRAKTAPSGGDLLVTRCCSIKDFDSLKNLQWDI